MEQFWFNRDNASFFWKKVQICKNIMLLEAFDFKVLLELLLWEFS